MLLLLIIYLLTDHGIFTTNATEIKGFAREGEFPFMAALLYKGSFKCGGSIISKEYILTAAHCLVKRDPLQMSALIGSIESKPGKGIVHNISRSIWHPDYDPISSYNDIGVVVVKNFMRLGTPNVNSISLSYYNEDYPSNYTITVIGYALNIGGHYEYVKLKYGRVPMWSRNECNAVVTPHLPDHMLCAADRKGKISFCIGDSGSPAVVENKVIGLVSFGFGCGTNYPVIFIRVASFRSWLRKIYGLD